jgi:hypothetical protein
MLEDQVDFVRQGALLSMAMVLQQTSEARSPSVKRFRELLSSIVTDKHQPILAKSGAIVAAGILDAGGCNVVVSMQSRAGFMKMVRQPPSLSLSLCLCHSLPLSPCLYLSLCVSLPLSLFCLYPSLSLSVSHFPSLFSLSLSLSLSLAPSFSLSPILSLPLSLLTALAG